MYWAARAESRLGPNNGPGGIHTISAICDGMDHSKFKYPRSSSVLVSKEFESFNRPSLDFHCLIFHGESILCAASEEWVPKDANWCLDLIGYSLHKAALRYDLRRTQLRLQCDNTCRELKNNSTLRAFSVWVACKRLFAAEMDCLQKGHTHEDVDGFFANLAVEIEKHGELHSPKAFREVVQRYLCGDGVRPYETEKEAVIVGSTRDWSSRLVSDSNIQGIVVDSKSVLLDIVWGFGVERIKTQVIVFATDVPPQPLEGDCGARSPPLVLAPEV